MIKVSDLNSRTTKWVAIVISSLLLIGTAIKFGFMYDQGLRDRFVPKEVYQLQVEVIKEDVKETKQAVKDISAQQTEDTRKLDILIERVGR